VRRNILNLLQCPRCRRGALAPPDPEAHEVLFGPVRCRSCDATFPVAEGIVDLVGERGRARTLAQRAMETPFLARSYERYMRAAFQKLSGSRVDDESRHVVLRSLLGNPSKPLLDLGCGAGALTRRLAATAGMPPVVGMDVSRPMLEEAIAQTRESGVRVDLVRAEAPELPFHDAVLGAVVLEGTLPLILNRASLLAEAARTLAPGGRLVATAHLPAGVGSTLLFKGLGVHTYDEAELRTELERAGFTRIERVRVDPLLMVKAEVEVR
jgi:SAM-dependent methyltransferase/uncharacterized protein YbaR (Trm112 family)